LIFSFIPSLWLIFTLWNFFQFYGIAQHKL
jgi:hypothetical protein